MKNKNKIISILLILIIVGSFYFFKNSEEGLIDKVKAEENLEKSLEAYYSNYNKQGLLAKYENVFLREDGSVDHEKSEPFKILFYYIDEEGVFKNKEIKGPDNSQIFTTLNGVTKYNNKIYHSFTPGIIESCEIFNNFSCEDNIFNLEIGAIPTINGFYPNTHNILLVAFQDDRVQLYKLDKSNNNTSKIFDSKLEGFSFNQTQTIIRDFDEKENTITLLSVRFNNGVTNTYYKLDLNSGNVLSVNTFNNEENFFDLEGFDEAVSIRKEKDDFINSSRNPEQKEYLVNYFDGGYVSIENQNFWKITD